MRTSGITDSLFPHHVHLLRAARAFREIPRGYVLAAAAYRDCRIVLSSSDDWPAPSTADPRAVRKQYTRSLSSSMLETSQAGTCGGIEALAGRTSVGRKGQG